MSSCGYGFSTDVARAALPVASSRCEQDARPSARRIARSDKRRDSDGRLRIPRRRGEVDAGLAAGRRGAVPGRGLLIGAGGITRPDCPRRGHGDARQRRYPAHPGGQFPGAGLRRRLRLRPGQPVHAGRSVHHRRGAALALLRPQRDESELLGRSGRLQPQLRPVLEVRAGLPHRRPVALAGPPGRPAA